MPAHHSWSYLSSMPAGKGRVMWVKRTPCDPYTVSPEERRPDWVAGQSTHWTSLQDGVILIKQSQSQPPPQGLWRDQRGYKTLYFNSESYPQTRVLKGPFFSKIFTRWTTKLCGEKLRNMDGIASTWEEAALRFFPIKTYSRSFLTQDEQQMLLSLTPPFVVHLHRQPGLATCLVMASSEAQKVSTS